MIGDSIRIECVVEDPAADHKKNNDYKDDQENEQVCVANPLVQFSLSEGDLLSHCLAGGVQHIGLGLQTYGVALDQAQAFNMCICLSLKL
jgi:hypothetical protein